MNWKLLLVLPFYILIFGCASPRGEVDDKSSKADSLLLEEIIPLIPSPGEFLDMVHTTGMNYQEGIVSPIVNPDNFVLYRNQALNFGVYLTDFSYLLLFEKQSESIKYLYQIQDLSKKLGVDGYFDDAFFNHLLANLSNPDSLKEISLQQSTLFFNRMNEIGNKDLVFLITTGAIIEGMSIASRAIDDNQITDDVIDRTIDLSYLFDTFYLHYDLSKPNDSSLEMLTTDITELRKIFTSMTIAQTSKSIRREGQIVLTSEVSHDINVYNLRKMKVMVDAIRKNIVDQVY
ncbi:MAG: hypothetical protein RBT74_08060 [Tenuifilaceae bacterium]|jgi:hypothetical protein|nr:hypothetical protein [Tenuifilaceae bacterium]